MSIAPSSLSAVEEIVLQAVQKNGNIKNIANFSELEIRVAVKDLEAKGLVKGWWSEAGSIITVTLNDRGKLYLEKHLKKKSVPFITSDGEASHVKVDDENTTKSNHGDFSSGFSSDFFGGNTEYKDLEDLVNDVNEAISKDDNSTSDDEAFHVKVDEKSTTKSNHGDFNSDFSSDFFGGNTEYKDLGDLANDVNDAISKDDNSTSEEKDELGINGEEESSDNNDYKYAIAEKYTITDRNIPECFQVDFLAEKFANHIDELNCEDSQMIGIFGAWGRGKTYFWEKAKGYLDAEKYTFVEFNAWKHQETPALWAYLYNSFQKEITSNGWSRFWYNIWQDRLKVVINLIILAVFILLVYSNIITMEKWVKVSLSVIVSILFLVKEIQKHLPFVVESLSKTIRGKDYSHHLGCQSEIESSLVDLLKYHIPNKKKSHNTFILFMINLWKCLFFIKNKNCEKVILFIDDIDRCKENEMVSIIDSLRTILENREIAERLIIVCAIDDHKLKLILSNKYKLLFKISDNDESKIEHIKYAREQMDKIFISGIKLSPICLEDQIQFIEKLIKIDDKQDIQASAVPSPSSLKVETPVVEKIESIEQTDKEGQLIMFKKILTTHCGTTDITPRQLRIIYYRYLLANNILNGSKIPQDQILKSIYLRTLDEKDETDLIATYKDVVNTVVCY